MGISDQTTTKHYLWKYTLMVGPQLAKNPKEVVKENCPAWCWLLNCFLMVGKGVEKCWCDEKLLCKRETKEGLVFQVFFKNNCSLDAWRGEQLFELISQLDVAVGTLQRTAAFGSTKLLSSANMEGRREAKVVLWEKEGIDERCWCCAPSAAWGDPHVAFSPVRAWRTQGLGWVRRWSWLPQLGISLSGHHHALKELSQSVGHGRRKICPLLTHEGNFCLSGAWQSHVWNSLQVSLKKGMTAKILSVLSQEGMLKSWKSVCLEKDTNTPKRRSGQLKYFDFDALHCLFHVCINFVTQYFSSKTVHFENFRARILTM